ncbi:MAG: type VI secretion system tip protein TssI/VgrG [Paracoccus sp. (in: a-proteobacteria)]|nr:type VI secretion system tip protein TssI/VgrG [Paracoccus sp. (in: a-proteobacteria)]
MNLPFLQAGRLGRLTTALGPDTLALLRFDGSDYLNDLFEYHIEALSPRGDLDFDSLIGTHAFIEIDSIDGPRPFDGIVTQARWAGVGENGHRYDLTLRPWFWLAGLRRNQRIFHNKTVIEILEELLAYYAHLGNPALEVSVSNDYPVLEYTVQHRESDLTFARRLMERFGISFHFRHQAGQHTMVLTDDPLAHDTIGARPFKSYDGHHQADGEHFWEWTPERNMTTGAVRLIDYNFKKPSAAMEVDNTGDATYAEGQIESFDYPGEFLSRDEGRLVALLRSQQERGGDRRNRAVGDCVSLGAGKRVTLTGDSVPGTGAGYICLAATHHFESEAYGTDRSRGSDGYAFTGRYTLMPDTAPMAPPRRTPPARMAGPQTAVVVGEGEIDCDEYGRVLVRFHWDLEGAISMRCRVSQQWAGNGLGAVVIPRIGMEVVVDFIDGDPDKPMVTGCVVNDSNANIYGLPDNKTKSGFKTKTHQGGGFNEMSLDDATGAERIFMHAQKDMDSIIQDNQTTQVVGGDRSVSVDKGDETKTIGKGNLTERVKLSRSTTANKINETAVAGDGGKGNITYQADNEVKVYGKDLVHTASKTKVSSYSENLMSYHSDKEGYIGSKTKMGVAGEESVAIVSKKLISIAVGDNTVIELTPEHIILSSNGSTISLSAGLIDQLAGMIHLNNSEGGEGGGGGGPGPAAV